MQVKRLQLELVVSKGERENYIEKSKLIEGSQVSKYLPNFEFYTNKP
jgi:hypothetical protein